MPLALLRLFSFDLFLPFPLVQSHDRSSVKPSVTNQILAATIAASKEIYGRKDKFNLMLASDASTYRLCRQWRDRPLTAPR